MGKGGMFFPNDLCLCQKHAGLVQDYRNGEGMGRIMNLPVIGSVLSIVGLFGGAYSLFLLFLVIFDKAWERLNLVDFAVLGATAVCLPFVVWGLVSQDRWAKEMGLVKKHKYVFRFEDESDTGFHPDF